jgi:PAS domain S-box-containing protein
VIIDRTAESDARCATDPLTTDRAVLEAVMDTLSEGTIVQSAAGVIEFANTQAQWLFSTPAAELIGRPLVDVVTALRSAGDDFLPAELPCEIARRTGLPVRDVLMGLPGPDGDIRWVVTTAVPVLTTAVDVDLLRVVSTFRDVTEALANENALQCLESIVESTDDAIFTTDLDGEIVSWNAGAEGVFGFSPVQIEGSSARVVLPDLPGDTFGAVTHDPFRGGAYAVRGAENLLTSGVRRDGVSITVSVSVAPVRDAGHEIIGFSVIARDVTAETETTELLRRSEQRLAALFRNVNSVVLVVGADALVSWASGSIEQLTGFPSDHYVDRRLHEGLEIDGSTLARIPNGTPEPGSPLVIEIRIRHRDGSWRWVEMSRVDLLDDPSVGGVVVNLHDITERREALDGVTASERRFRQIVETTQEGIWTADASGHTTLVNEAMAGMLGYEPHEMEGVRIDAFLPVQQRELAGKRFARALAGRSDRFELSLLCKDGSEIVARASLSPIWNGSAEGPVTGVMAMMTDITEVRRREEAIRMQASLLESIGEAVLAVDVDGTLLYANPATYRLLQWSPDESFDEHAFALAGRHASEAAVRQLVDQLYNEGRWSGELELSRRDGTRFPALVNASMLYDDSRQPSTIACVIVDLTERKRSVREARVRAAQQASVARLAWSALRDQPLSALCDEAVAEVANVLHVGAAGVFLPERATVADKLGDARLAHGSGWLEGNATGITLKPSVCRALESAEVGEALTFDRGASGQDRPLLDFADGPEVSTGIALRIDGDDHCYGVLAVCSGPARVVSEDDQNFLRAVAAIIGSAFSRHQTNDALVLAEEAERLRLSEGIHDDHLQVMAAVALRLEAFGRTHLLGQQRASLDVLIGDVRMAAERLRNLIFELVPEEVDEKNLADLIRRVLDHSSEDANFTFDFEASLNAPLPEAVGVVVLRTAQEAIVNIRKHAHASHVEVHLESTDDATRVRISDNGVGIPPGELGRSEPGHIGISSMRKRVRRMGGEWEITSDLGVGTTVSFFVPHSSSPTEVVDGGWRTTD